jgi:hypothetical protein
MWSESGTDSLFRHRAPAEMDRGCLGEKSVYPWLRAFSTLVMHTPFTSTGDLRFVE